MTKDGIAGFQWTIRKDWETVLREHVLGKLDAVGQGLGEVVKNNKMRMVVRVRIPGAGEVFVKRYKLFRLREFLKHVVRGSKALHEWTIGNGLVAAGAPTPLPLAVGVRRWPNPEAWLVTQGIADAVPLRRIGFGDYAKPLDHAMGREKRRLTVQLGELMARLHQHGFFHRDLHSANMLVQRSADVPRLFVLDLHSLRHVRRFSQRHRLANLGMLNASLSFPTVTRHDKLRFLSTYAKSLDLPWPNVRTWLLDIERVTRAVLEREARSRTRRCLQTSGGYVVESVAGGRVYRRREVSLAVAERIVAEHKTLPQGDPRLLKWSAETVVSRLTVPTEANAVVSSSVCVKQYRSGGALEALKGVFRRPPGLRAWVAGHGLRARKVPAAEPLALLEERTGDAFLVMTALDEGEQIDRYVFARFRGPLDPAAVVRKRACLKRFAETLAYWHGRGVFQRDLKPSNVFVAEQGDGWRFALIDLDGVRFRGRLELELRLKNLSHLNSSAPRCITRTDRLRFLNWYFEASDLIVPPRDTLSSVVTRILDLSRKRGYYTLDDVERLSSP